MAGILRLGFTGTRAGLAPAQLDALLALVLRLAPHEAHHGCAVGADGQLHRLLRPHLPDCRIVGHPCTVVRDQDAGALAGCDELREVLPPLERNRNIVAACDVLLAAPRGNVEERRSGTWATVRCGLKAGKDVRLVYPDGEVATPGAG
jgi:hypothetical protein